MPFGMGKRSTTRAGHCAVLPRERMTPAEFREAGETLYGTGWQVKLARNLGRDDRTIRRWKTGESPVPKAVVAWLREKINKLTVIHRPPFQPAQHSPAPIATNTAARIVADQPPRKSRNRPAA
jgi:hypothetical protein